MKYSGAVTVFLAAAALAAQSNSPQYLSFAQARPVLEALGEGLPAPAAWPSWIAENDRNTRSRVAEGDETSIVYWLLFGTTFTSQPRITTRQIDSKEITEAVTARVADLERALAAPGGSERLQFARQVLGTGPVRPRLLSMLDRVMKEGDTHARLAEAAQALGDPSLEFAERSRMYRARGLSTDTSLKINFAVEEALKDLGPTLKRGSQAKPAVRRVAIVGPGLDFTDKQEGHDFYGPQTIQPSAVQDSLIRLGLANADALEVTAFDLSRRVSGHIEMAAERARGGASYIIHLPLDGGVSWTPAFLEYWRRFGDTIGSPVPVSIPPALPGLRLRAVSLRPPAMQRLRVIDLNVTAQYLALPEAEKFDVVIGTNVFLYYDRPQQGLAMAGIANMLKPGGVLLSNNALVEIPTVGFRSIGYSKVMYSSREEDGDLIVWYQKAPK